MRQVKIFLVYMNYDITKEHWVLHYLHLNDIYMHVPYYRPLSFINDNAEEMTLIEMRQQVVGGRCYNVKFEPEPELLEE